jgi:hypothetical protein
VERDGQALQAAVEVAADGGLHPQDRGRLDPAAHEGQDRLDRAEPEGHQCQWQQQAPLATRHRAVDDRLGHQRDDDAGADAEQGRREHREHLSPKRPDVGSGSPQCLQPMRSRP